MHVWTERPTATALMNILGRTPTDEELDEERRRYDKAKHDAAEVELHTITIAGLTYRITVHKTSGRFSAYETKPEELSDNVDDNYRSYYHQSPTQTEETLAKLLEKLTPKVKRQAIQVSVPFDDWKVTGYNRERNPHKGTLRHGIITGIHAGHGKYMVRWAGETGVDYVDGYHLDGYLSRLSPSETEQYLTAQATASEAYENVKALEKIFAPKTSLKTQVEAALKIAEAAATAKQRRAS